MDEDIYLSYDELKEGGIFVGTNTTYSWGNEFLIVGRDRHERVLYRNVDESDNRTYIYILLNDPGRKYRMKLTSFKYNPDQTGDREDDI